MKDDKRDEHGAETPKDPAKPSGGKAPVRPLDEPSPSDPKGVPEGPGDKP